MGFISRFTTRVQDILHPFASIAQELRIIRELYEADLASRTPPVYRVVEDPTDGDTTVTYGDGKPTKRTKADDLAESWAAED